MGELDDALAGLRGEALAATAGDFERVRRARRSYVARRATAAALGVALVVGGGAIAFAGNGFLDAGDRNRVLVNPTATESPQPTPSASESVAPTPVPAPSTTDRPYVPGQTEWTSLSLLGKAGTLLGRRCDGDGIACDIVVRSTTDGARTFAAPVLVAKATFDPDVQSSADHTATQVVETSRGTWLYGASLFYSDDRAHWSEVKVTGIVNAVLADDSGTVAVIQQCTTMFPDYAGCRLVIASLGQGTVESSATYAMADGEHVRDVAGTPGTMVVQIADNLAVQRELVGSHTKLAGRDSVCRRKNSVSLVVDDVGLLALCGYEPSGGAQPKELYQLKGYQWEPLGAAHLAGSNVRLFSAGRRLVAVPGRGPISVSDDGGLAWAEVLPEVDGEAVLRWNVTESNGEIVLLSNANDPQGRQIWRSTDGTNWSGARIS